MSGHLTSPRVQKLTVAAVCITLDVLLLTFLIAVVAIVATGGGAIQISGVTIRARSVENPIWILTALVLLRYAAGDWPILGVRRWSFAAALERGIALMVRVPVAAEEQLRRPVTGLAFLAVLVFLMRVFLAWISPGFFSGDDVEIHEMTLGALLRKSWPVWDLRCAFFPMVFVYPAQHLALAIGWSSPDMLVFAGRTAVALLSVAAIPLTWYAARRLAPDEPRLAAVAVLLLAINKLQMSFGSSELPRPVATVFVLAAFLCAMRGGAVQSVLAGVFLGVAVAFRFSEAVFIPAALVTLGRRRYVARASLLLVFAAATAVAIIAVSDALYWREPLSSLAAAVDYTVLRRQSSRGYEPPWEYLKIIPAWSTYFIVTLAVAGSSRRAPEAWWLWLPIGILSLLPHKESRYLLPVIPFLCIAAARGLLWLAGWLAQGTGAVGWRRWVRELAAPVLVLAVLHDIGGWRLPRSNEGVRLAEYLRARGVRGIAGQDLWRLGGRPYLWPLEPVIEVTPTLLADSEALGTALMDARCVVLRSRVARTVGDAALQAQRFTRDPAWMGEDYVLYTAAR